MQVESVRTYSRSEGELKRAIFVSGGVGWTGAQIWVQKAVSEIVLTTPEYVYLGSVSIYSHPEMQRPSAAL